MKSKIAKNTFFLSASQVLSRAIGFLYVIFLARVLGVRNFGIYSFTLAFVYNFIPVADFGIERLVLRDVSRDLGKASFYLSRLLPLRLALALGAYVLVLLLALGLGQDSQQIFYLAIFGLALIPYSLTFLFSSFLNAKEKMKYMAFANIMQISLTALFGGMFVFLKLGLVWILLAYPLANFLTAGTFVLKARKWGLPLGWRIDISFWKEKLSQSWIFATFTIISVFYLRISLILVNFFHGPEATGLYGAPFKFLEAMILIPQSVALALFPLSSQLFSEDKQRLRSIYKKGLGFQFFSSLIFISPLIFFPSSILTLAYGREYLSAAPVFPILGIALIFFFINSLAGNVIHNSPQVKKFLPFLLLNLTVKITLCLLLIPNWSIIGAAWAVAAAESFGFLINNYFVWRVLK